MERKAIRRFSLCKIESLDEVPACDEAHNLNHTISEASLQPVAILSNGLCARPLVKSQLSRTLINHRAKKMVLREDGLKPPRHGTKNHR